MNNLYFLRKWPIFEERFITQSLLHGRWFWRNDTIWATVIVSGDNLSRHFYAFIARLTAIYNNQGDDESHNDDGEGNDDDDDNMIYKRLPGSVIANLVNVWGDYIDVEWDTLPP